MSKKIKKLLPYVVALVAFFLTSFIQIPRDQPLICDHNGKGEHKEYRQEFGLPSAYIKRSVSDFECRLEGKQLFENFPSWYGRHEVNYGNLVSDVYIWLTATYFVMKLCNKRTRQT